ncbi:MAG: tryptophanase [Sandaracinaceae bacterium]|nr:tryptophanase [Sandaracinaceae bacterium]
MGFRPSTIIEPFRVKVVEPLPVTTRAERARHLERARNNLFALHAEHVTIDLMTDSGTGAMSQEQWAAIMRGDESYAGSTSFFELEKVLRDLTGKRHVIPTHQGRAAERILFGALVGDATDSLVPANTHFDTTRANVEAVGAEAHDLPVAEALDPQSDHPFKGDLDLERLRAFLDANAPRVPAVVMTVTNNSAGGQPVSLENLRAVRDLVDDYGVPLFLDCARFAENAYLIKLHEPGQGHRTTEDIAQEMFRLADGAWMSAKKDGLVNIGGFLVLDDDALATRCRNSLILTEGFPTYGGLAGRDLAALAVGLREVLDERYLDYRIASVRYLYEHLHARGVPLLGPPGGHAVYLDATRFLPHVPAGQLPGQAVAIALYLEAGIRSCEIGTVMFGHTQPDGTQATAALELVRLAIPRRVYTQSHVDYVAEAVGYVFEGAAELGGYRIVDEPPALRHFTCGFERAGAT